MRRLCSLLVALFFALPLAVRAGEPAVIVLSWDGVRHDDPGRLQLPALERMAREGARAERLVPVLPSDTFPGHVSLATGTHPDRHGIVGNVFRDRERGDFDYDNDASWLLAEPLWAAAERQGVPAATFFWVGSETPWRGVAARHRRAPFDAEVPEREKVDQILDWLDLPEPERPRLVMSWWRGADRAGHRHGPGSEAVDAALRAQDAELARLLEGIDARGRWSELTLFVVSDHGMSLATRGIDLVSALDERGFAGDVVHGGAVAHVFLEAPDRAAAAAAALATLEGVEAHVGRELPAALRLAPAARRGDVVCIAEPPYTFRASRVQRALRLLDRGIGGHGYHWDHEDVHAVLFAMGRGVAAGARPGRVHAIDLAPTVARLLGIEPPAASEGRVVELGRTPGPGSSR